MMGGSTAREVRSVVRLSTFACLAAAAVCIVAASIAGRAAAGAELAIGIVIGAANAHMTQRLLNVGVPFMATSMLRIMAMTAAAGVVGLIIGLDHVWLIVAGLGVAQLIMSGSALREMKR
jgi:hypothetical protein